LESLGLRLRIVHLLPLRRMPSLPLPPPPQHLAELSPASRDRPRTAQISSSNLFQQHFLEYQDENWVIVNSTNIKAISIQKNSFKLPVKRSESPSYASSFGRTGPSTVSLDVAGSSSCALKWNGSSCGSSSAPVI
jgi:hypothetical protein